MNLLITSLVLLGLIDAFLRHPLYLPGRVRPTPFDPERTDRVMDLNAAQAVEVKR